MAVSGSEFHQDQNSKLWIQKGYCVPKICKRHKDCQVGDYCNGGSTYGGACRLNEDTGYLIAKCVIIATGVRPEDWERK